MEAEADRHGGTPPARAAWCRIADRRDRASRSSRGDAETETPRAARAATIRGAQRCAAASPLSTSQASRDHGTPWIGRPLRVRVQQRRRGDRVRPRVPPPRSAGRRDDWPRGAAAECRRCCPSRRRARDPRRAAGIRRRDAAATRRACRVPAGRRLRVRPRPACETPGASSREGIATTGPGLPSPPPPRAPARSRTSAATPSAAPTRRRCAFRRRGLRGRRSAPSRRSRPARSRRARAAPAARLSSRYACGCSSKRSQDGIDTTRERIPSATSDLVRRDGQTQFAAGRDQHQLRDCRPARRRAHRRRARRRRRRVARAVERRERLARQRQQRRADDAVARATR